MISSKFLGLVLALIVVTSCSSTVPKVDLAAGTDPAAKLVETETRLNTAISKRYDLLSPEHFKDAREALAEAHEKTEKGEPAEKVLADIGQAMAHVQIVEENGDKNAPALATVLSAREFAVKAKADSTFPGEFNSADREIQKFGEDIEDNDFHPEAEQVSKLEGRYSQLELLAIKHNNLSAVRSLIQKAEKSDAEDKTPQTYNVARVEMDSASRAIEANRRNPEGYQAQVAKAITSAQKLDSVLKTVISEKAPEATAIQIYDQQQRLAATENSLQDANLRAKALQTKGQGDLQNIKTLQGQNQEYADRLAFNQKIEKLKSEFGPSEAEVVRDGNKIIIRLKSMQFSSARSELTASSLGTLQKVKEMIVELPVAKVVVEGHTDSVGSEQLNMDLSQKRAEAVKEYFVAEKTLPEEKFEAKGFGYERPLTTNKTKQGRAVNRRVDVVIETTTTS